MTDWATAAALVLAWVWWRAAEARRREVDRLRREVSDLRAEVARLEVTRG